MDVKGIGWEGE